MEKENLEIATGSTGTYMILRLAGMRDPARANEVVQRFFTVYSAQPIRSLLVDLRLAHFPEPLCASVEHFSRAANLCPRSRVALWIENPNDPVAILLAQTACGACHDVLLTADIQEAERFLQARQRRDLRPGSFEPVATAAR